jgi:hypothetical protein
MSFHEAEEDTPVAVRLHEHPDYPQPCTRLYYLVQDMVDAFPEAGTDEEINGADAVEWIVPWIIDAREALKAGQP